MARTKKAPPEPPAIEPWMATFSDLMNLLLCFFVLLFSFSSVDSEAFEQIAQSFRSTVSIFPDGGPFMGDGMLVSNGVSHLEGLSEYFSELGESEKEKSDGVLSGYEAMIKGEKLDEAENIAEEITNKISDNLESGVDVNFTSQYVELVLNGSLLFGSGTANIKSESKALLNKIGDILWQYDDCVIEIIGHTDSVPISRNTKYDSNLELSCARAISVAEYLNAEKNIPMASMKTAGCGEYMPVASNDTSEGRAQNRRVEIKIHFNVE